MVPSSDSSSKSGLVLSADGEDDRELVRCLLALVVFLYSCQQVILSYEKALHALFTITSASFYTLGYGIVMVRRKFFALLYGSTQLLVLVVCSFSAIHGRASF